MVTSCCWGGAISGGLQVLGYLLPDGSNIININNSTALGSGGGLDILNRTKEWAAQNWTEEWLDLVDEDPSVRFAGAEYLPESSEVRVAPFVCVCVCWT